LLESVREQLAIRANYERIKAERQARNADRPQADFAVLAADQDAVAGDVDNDSIRAGVI